MYRIRSASGTEAVYNSLEEFHAAVRRGEVSPEDEIFHTRANRWLDVKSHPHYRSAVGWNGSPDTLQPLAPPAPPTAPPRTTSGPFPPPRAPEVRNGNPVRPEPMRVAPPPTLLRPQLQADQSAVNPAGPARGVSAPPPPPRKSRELAFIDLGEPQPPKSQNATIIQAQKPSVAAPPANPARTEPVAPDGGEAPFLIMDNGIESPARNSAGHRTVTEDLDLLFDTPLGQPSKPAVNGAAVTRAAPPRPEPPPQPAAPRAPEVSAPPALPPPPRPSAPRLDPVVAQHAAVEPRPVIPTPVEPTTTTESKVAPARSAAPAFKVIREEPTPSESTAAVDLEIPGIALLGTPVVAPPYAQPPSPRRLPNGLVYGAGGLVLVLGVAIALWRPWSRAPDAGLSEQPATSTASEPVGTGGSALSGANPALFGGRPRDSALPAQTDSVIEPAKETVLAAERPDFRADVDVGAAGLSLDGDLPAGLAGAVSVVAPSELARRLTQAERQAQQELAGKLGGFRSLLALERIGTAEGAGRARATWLSGADALRQYRARIARLEQAYEDSVLTAQRAQRWPAEELRAWTARQSLAEPAEVAQLAELMVSQVSEGLELLAASEGQYQIKGDRIAFTTAAAVPRYLSIRSWVEQRSGTWQGTPENARPHTLNAMLRALGEGFPAAQ